MEPAEPVLVSLTRSMYTKWNKFEEVTILVLSLKSTPNAPLDSLYPSPYFELKSTNLVTSSSRGYSAHFVINWGKGIESAIVD